MYLGGVIKHRIMTRDEIKTFADLSESGGLEGAHSRLLNTLNASTSETLRLLGYHGSELIGLLQNYSASSGEHSMPSSSDSSDSSDSGSSDSDSSDSEPEKP